MMTSRLSVSPEHDCISFYSHFQTEHAIHYRCIEERRCMVLQMISSRLSGEGHLKRAYTKPNLRYLLV